MISNVELVSPWYSANELDDFLSQLCRGDRLEFDRGAYRHWAICVTVGIDAHVVHRTGDGSGLLRASVVSSTRTRDVGMISLDSLLTVLSTHRVRINNFRDRRNPPKPEYAIVMRAVTAIDNEEEHGLYNLVSNNCEHFVNWCRYGIRMSHQAVLGTLGVGTLGVLAAVALRSFRLA